MLVGYSATTLALFWDLPSFPPAYVEQITDTTLIKSEPAWTEDLVWNRVEKQFAEV